MGAVRHEVSLLSDYEEMKGEQARNLSDVSLHGMLSDIIPRSPRSL